MLKSVRGGERADMLLQDAASPFHILKQEMHVCNWGLKDNFSKYSMVITCLLLF